MAEYICGWRPVKLRNCDRESYKTVHSTCARQSGQLSQILHSTLSEIRQQSDPQVREQHIQV